MQNQYYYLDLDNQNQRKSNKTPIDDYLKVRSFSARQGPDQLFVKYNIQPIKPGLEYIDLQQKQKFFINQQKSDMKQKSTYLLKSIQSRIFQTDSDHFQSKPVRKGVTTFSMHDSLYDTNNSHKQDHVSLSKLISNQNLMKKYVFQNQIYDPEEKRRRAASQSPAQASLNKRLQKTEPRLVVAGKTLEQPSRFKFRRNMISCHPSCNTLSRKEKITIPFTQVFACQHQCENENLNYQKGPFDIICTMEELDLKMKLFNYQDQKLFLNQGFQVAGQQDKIDESSENSFKEEQIAEIKNNKPDNQQHCHFSLMYEKQILKIVDFYTYEAGTYHNLVFMLYKKFCYLQLINLQKELSLQNIINEFKPEFYKKINFNSLYELISLLKNNQHYLDYAQKPLNLRMAAQSLFSQYQQILKKPFISIIFDAFIYNCIQQFQKSSKKTTCLLVKLKATEFIDEFKIKSNIQEADNFVEFLHKYVDLQINFEVDENYIHFLTLIQENYDITPFLIVIIGLELIWNTQVNETNYDDFNLVYQYLQVIQLFVIVHIHYERYIQSKFNLIYQKLIPLREERLQQLMHLLNLIDKISTMKQFQKQVFKCIQFNCPVEDQIYSNYYAVEEHNLDQSHRITSVQQSPKQKYSIDINQDVFKQSSQSVQHIQYLLGKQSSRQERTSIKSAFQLNRYQYLNNKENLQKANKLDSTQ